MSLMRMHASPAIQRSAPPFRRVSSILLSFALLLAVFFLGALLLAGESRLLTHAATIKPYSIAYLSPYLLTGEVTGSDPQNLVIFLGDSSVAQPPWAQKGLPGIPDLLQGVWQESYQRTPHILVSDWSFAGGRLFHYYCLLFEAEKHNPSLLVIPINWRSIGPLSDEWNETFAYPELSSLVPAPERSFPSSEKIMKIEGVSHPMQVLYAAHRPMLYVTGLKALILSKLGSNPPLVPQIEVLQKLAPGEHLIERYSDDRLFSQYASLVAEDTASLQALRLIVETAERRNIRVLFYITPIHLDEMRSRLSFDTTAFETSIKRIIKAGSSDMTICLDLSGLLTEAEFVDNYEHYTHKGNRKIALALAPVVEESLNR